MRLHSYNSKEKPIIIALDHDGTLSSKDIGKQYLSSAFERIYEKFKIQGRTYEEKFINLVKDIRNGKYNDLIEKELHTYYNPKGDHGIELALITLLESKYNGLRKEKIYDIIDNIKKESILKKGAMNFLKKDEYETYISTAGIEEFLSKIYKELEIKDDDNSHNFYIVGTKLAYDGNGKPIGIISKNGRYQKIINIKKELKQKLNLDENNYKLIGVGDSSGDSDILLNISKNHGIGISSGEGAGNWSNIIVHNKDPNSFYGEIASIIVSENLLKGKNEKEALKNLENYFGNTKNVGNVTFEKGKIENKYSERLLKILNNFNQKYKKRKIII